MIHAQAQELRSPDRFGWGTNPKRFTVARRSRNELAPHIIEILTSDGQTLRFWQDEPVTIYERG